MGFRQPGWGRPGHDRKFSGACRGGDPGPADSQDGRQPHVTIGVESLIKGMKFDAILTDKAFGANWIIEDMNERGAQIATSQ